MHFITVLYLLGASQGLFLALALFFKKNGIQPANSYLGALTLAFVAALLDYALDTSGVTNDYPFIRTLLWPKEFLYGIFIYLYIKALTQPQHSLFQDRQCLHFVPALIHVLITWPLLFLENQRQFLILTDQVTSGRLDQVWALVLGDVEVSLSIIQLSLYLFFSFRLILKHERRISQTFSNTEKISLRWLKNLLISIFVLYVIWILDEIWSFPFGSPSLFSQALLGGGMVIVIYGMGFMGLIQHQIFSPQTATYKQSESINQNLEHKPNKLPEKYQNSPLSPDMTQALLDELKYKMDSEKLYLDNQLSLPQLAQVLNVSNHYLSQVINQQTGMNFFDFINRYRVDLAKQKLISPSSQTENILSIAMDSGFNSKSSFYTAFKKHTGMTPSQYRKAIS